jgi:hypothetical protein
VVYLIVPRCSVSSGVGHTQDVVADSPYVLVGRPYRTRHQQLVGQSDIHSVAADMVVLLAFDLVAVPSPAFAVPFFLAFLLAFVPPFFLLLFGRGSGSDRFLVAVHGPGLVQVPSLVVLGFLEYNFLFQA